MAVPTVPNFNGVTVPSIAALNQLSTAVNFLCNASVRPLWHVVRESVDALSGGVWFFPTWFDIAYDSDNCFQSLNTAVINTQGVYATEGCAVLQAVNGNNIHVAMAFVVTGGGNNPNLSNGSQYWYGFRGMGMEASSSGFSMTPCDLTPFPLYPNDTVDYVIGALVSTSVVRPFSNAAINEARFMYQFTGYWVGIG